MLLESVLSTKRRVIAETSLGLSIVGRIFSESGYPIGKYSLLRYHYLSRLNLGKRIFFKTFSNQTIAPKPFNKILKRQDENSIFSDSCHLFQTDDARFFQFGIFLF